MIGTTRIFLHRYVFISIFRFQCCKWGLVLLLFSFFFLSYISNWQSFFKIVFRHLLGLVLTVAAACQCSRSSGASGKLKVTMRNKMLGRCSWFPELVNPSWSSAGCSSTRKKNCFGTYSYIQSDRSCICCSYNNCFTFI